MRAKTATRRSPPQDPSPAARGFSWAVWKGFAPVISFGGVIYHSGIICSSNLESVFDHSGPLGGGCGREEGKRGGCNEHTGIASLAPEGLGSGALPQGVIELSDDESEGLIASFTATGGTGPFDASPSTPRVTTLPDMSGDWEFACRLSMELNREEIPGDKELAQKLFVELNREALGTTGDGALVDLVSDDEDIAAAGINGEAEKAVSSDEEEEDAATHNRSPEQADAPPSPPPSA
jgi:hypothetical protein